MHKPDSERGKHKTHRAVKSIFVEVCIRPWVIEVETADISAKSVGAGSTELDISNLPVSDSLKQQVPAESLRRVN